MTRIVEWTYNEQDRPAHLEEWYSTSTDAYDIDAYAYAYNLDTYGMGSHKFNEDRSNEIAYMDAYNANRHTGDQGEAAAGWLAKLARGIVSLVIALAAGLLAR